MVVSGEMQQAVDEESFEFLMEGKTVFFSLFFVFGRLMTMSPRTMSGVKRPAFGEMNSF